MSANILVFNCGSSSLIYRVYRYNDNAFSVLASGKAHHVATKSQAESFLVNRINGSEHRVQQTFDTHEQAADAVFDSLEKHAITIDLVGHRFVHGGSDFQESTLLTPASQRLLEANLHLAPIHNPNSYSVIQLTARRYPSLLQYMVFDTTFHACMPEVSRSYALPHELAERYGLRKYGFHGLSYQYVTQQVAEYLDQPLESLKMVVCHLGSGGSSVAAVRDGYSIQTSMGYSPLPGLIMSTRCGDVDAMIVLELIEQHGYSAHQVNELLNKQSGLLGITGFSSDIRELIRVSAEQPRARLAVEMYTQRLKETIGAYSALLGGMDALVFTDDIGVQCWQVRAAACQGLEFLGVLLDEDANRTATWDSLSGLNAADSAVKVLALPTDEEIVIAREGIRFLR